MKGITKLSFALVLAPVLGACQANSQYKAALDEADMENRQLREERSVLKEGMRDLEFQRASLETALAEANARLLAEPEPVARQDDSLSRHGIGVGTRDGMTVITVPSEITFASGKADLSKGGRSALMDVARYLDREHPQGEYWLHGHTDSDPIKKSKFRTNRDLSLARAMAVLHFLVEDGGMADDAFVVAGMGEYHPVASNDTKANKARNRRVEIVVHQAR